MDSLRTIAQEMKCAVIGIGERNRASMSGGGQNATAGTRAFEYVSETVLELQAKKDATLDADGKMGVDLTLSKNRNGSPGKKIDLIFTGRLQKFEEV